MYTTHVAPITALVLGVLAGRLHAAEPARFIKNLEAGKKQHVVTYGTSLTEGGPWVGMLRQSLAAKYSGMVTVTNSGKSAMWSGWGVENLEERILKKNPDAVIIEFAINDAFLNYKTSAKMCRSNLENMIDRILKQNPACEIVLMTMNPPVGKHLTARPDIEDYYQVYRDVAKARKLLLVDHYPNWKAVLDKDRKLFDDYVPDGIHPNAKGCEKVIMPALNAVLYGKP